MPFSCLTERHYGDGGVITERDDQEMTPDANRDNVGRKKRYSKAVDAS